VSFFERRAEAFVSDDKALLGEFNRAGRDDALRATKVP
jgi:hypothetical protein